MDREPTDLEPVLREDLLATYRRPFRRFFPVALNEWQAKRVAVRGGIGFGLMSLAVLAGSTDPAGGLRLLAGLAGVTILGFLGLVAAQTALAVRRHTRSWRRRDRSALAQVREERPHRGELDREVAHSEYAVEVGDDGFLRTWCFTPLPSYAASNRVALTGTPRYAAEEVHRRAFDALDVSRAAEALAEEQDQAARWEAEAAAEGLLALSAAAEARTLEEETRSTAAALRGATGVRRRR